MTDTTGVEEALKRIVAQANEIAEDLEAFTESAKVFSADDPRLIDKYENRWVGVYRGQLVADAATLAEMSETLAARGVPLNETMVRRIDREEKTLIL